jgi:hypothetical protein
MKATITAERKQGQNMYRCLIAALWFVAISLGALNAWTNRYGMSSDGVSYLDMGDAYMRGDWAMAVNAYWSPFYSWLLGLAMFILRPTSPFEFPVVRLVNFTIFLAAAVSFHFFLWNLVRFRSQRALTLYSHQSKGLWGSPWILSGYALFIWSSVELVTLKTASPDLCISAFVYLLSGLILRIRSGSTRWSAFALLGLVLGFAYLAKAPMFPLAFVFLAVCLYPAENIRKTAIGVSISFIVFLSVAGPFMWALSATKHRPTFGDSGKLNYAWYTGAPHRHWQGEPAGNGVPSHPTRKIWANPDVYEFADPIRGSYPPWFDPSYWYEGVTPRFSFAKQMVILAENARIYRRLLFPYLTVLLAGLLVLLKGSQRKRVHEGLREHLSLIIPAAAAMSMYWLVHMERRFIGAFLVTLWMGLLSSAVWGRSEEPKKSEKIIIGTMALSMLTAAIIPGIQNGLAVYREAGDRVTGFHHPDLIVAQELKQMGLRPGDKVAVIGWGSGMSAWARLARIAIVAEIPEGRSLIPHGPSFHEGEKFWAANTAEKTKVFRAMAETGAKVIVARIPDPTLAVGWERMGKTDFYAYPLKR